MKYSTLCDVMWTAWKFLVAALYVSVALYGCHLMGPEVIEPKQNDVYNH